MNGVMLKSLWLFAFLVAGCSSPIQDYPGKALALNCCWGQNETGNPYKETTNGLYFSDEGSFANQEKFNAFGFSNGGGALYIHNISNNSIYPFTTGDTVKF